MISLTLDKKVIEAIATGLRNKNAVLLKAATVGLHKGMLNFIGHIVKTQMSGRPGLKAPTGKLRQANSVIDKVQGLDIISQAQFGFPNAPYTIFHQIGGRFTSRGKMFTIPLTPEAEKSRPRDHADLTMIKSKNNQLLLGRRSVNFPYKFTPMWVLKRTINIPKRLHIYEEFQARGIDILGAAYTNEIHKAFPKSGVAA